MAPSSGTALPREDRISYLLKRAEQALTVSKTRALRDVDLTVAQYTALLVLADEPGLSGAQLARRCHVTPQTMAAVLAKLESRSLVERRSSAVHAQVMQTVLTRHGRAVLRKADRIAIDVEGLLSDAFSTDDRRRLVTLLGAVTDALESRHVSGG